MSSLMTERVQRVIKQIKISFFLYTLKFEIGSFSVACSKERFEVAEIFVKMKSWKN
jgi:hypothetical protein